MLTVEWQEVIKDTTLLGITGQIPQMWMGKLVKIGEDVFNALFVMDLPGHIAIKGKGSFIGKQVTFL